MCLSPLALSQVARHSPPTPPLWRSAAGSLTVARPPHPLLRRCAEPRPRRCAMALPAYARVCVGAHVARAARRPQARSSCRCWRQHVGRWLYMCVGCAGRWLQPTGHRNSHISVQDHLYLTFIHSEAFWYTPHAVLTARCRAYCISQLCNVKSESFRAKVGSGFSFPCSSMPAPRAPNKVRPQATLRTYVVGHALVAPGPAPRGLAASTP